MHQRSQVASRLAALSFDRIASVAGHCAATLRATSLVALCALTLGACGGEAEDEDGTGGLPGSGGKLGVGGTGGTTGPSGGSGGSGGSSTSSSPSGPGSFDSGLPPGQPLSELSAAQSEALCRELFDYQLQVLEDDAYCLYVANVTAAYAADPEQACLDSLAQCDDSLRELEEALNADSYCQGNVPDSTCEATVGDLETCSSESVGQFRAAYSRVVRCSELEAYLAQDPELDQLLIDPTTATACSETSTSSCSLYY